MARLVRLEATGPLKITATDIPEGKGVFICQCGLSKRLPYCDGSHKPLHANPEQPGTLYIYGKDRSAIVETRADA